MAKRIIVPLDRSKVAESALPLARGLVAQLDLPVTLISVVDVPPALAAHVPGGDRPPAPQVSSTDVPTSPYGRWTGWSSMEASAADIERAVENSTLCEKYLDSIAETFEGVPVETIVRFGPPSERILQTAEERPGSIIVMASHGRSGVAQTIAGSIASEVLRGTTSPVFVTRATPESSINEEPITVRKALVALDASTFSEQSLPVLEEIFGADTLDIHLVNVVEKPFSNPKQNEGYLKWIAEKLATETSSVTCESCEGTPAEAINRMARESHADLIVMTTHGYSGIRRLVLGSVAERVLHLADRPLLLIRPME